MNRHKHRNKLLFILKQREANWGSYESKESGLSNSVRFVTDMLSREGVDAVVEQAIDNNCIDRLVTKHRPTHVIIEAFWVVPEKFDVLIPLHRDVQWIVRNHSETPFLANEGIAFGWVAEYLKRGVEVMCNSPRAVVDMVAYASACNQRTNLITYGPNVYPIPSIKRMDILKDFDDEVINIGCFGAVRPLKNHMEQAVAAMLFADSVGKKLRFHINGSRIEGKGDPILKNIQEGFSHSHHELVEHNWLNHENFLKVLEHEIDIAMQVSFTETFNIVAADAMSLGKPIVSSSEIPWLGDYSHVNPTNLMDIVQMLLTIYQESPRERLSRAYRQRMDMIHYVNVASSVWTKRFK